MKLGFLLGSPARTEILRALACQPGNVGLRQSARIAGVLPHSAELALASLLRDKLVKCEVGRRARYRLNRDHSEVAVLEAMFAAATVADIRSRSASLQARARSLLPFFRDARRMLAHARESRHVD